MVLTKGMKISSKLALHVRKRIKFTPLGGGDLKLLLSRLIEAEKGRKKGCSATKIALRKQMVVMQASGHKVVVVNSLKGSLQGCF